MSIVNTKVQIRPPFLVRIIRGKLIPHYIEKSKKCLFQRDGAYRATAYIDLVQGLSSIAWSMTKFYIWKKGLQEFIDAEGINYDPETGMVRPRVQEKDEIKIEEIIS